MRTVEEPKKAANGSKNHQHVSYVIFVSISSDSFGRGPPRFIVGHVFHDASNPLKHGRRRVKQSPLLKAEHWQKGKE